MSRATWLAAALLATVLAAPARAAVDIHVNLGAAPPPPVIMFRDEPGLVRLSGTRVYVIEPGRRPAYDLFVHNDRWYIYRDGWWYRAADYDGPYRAVRMTSVPTAVRNVPARHWRSHPHGGPPGQVKKMKGAGHGRSRGAGRGR